MKKKEEVVVMLIILWVLNDDKIHDFYMASYGFSELLTKFMVHVILGTNKLGEWECKVLFPL